MQPLTAAPQTVSDVLAATLRSTPFQALTAVVALVSLVLAAISFYRTHIRGPKLSFLPADGLDLGGAQQ